MAYKISRDSNGTHSVTNTETGHLHYSGTREGAQQTKANYEAKSALASNDAPKPKPPLTPDSPQFNPDSPSGRFTTRSPRPS